MESLTICVMSESPILFEEIFEVRSVNPDGKAFEKGELVILH